MSGWNVRRLFRPSHWTVWLSFCAGLTGRPAAADPQTSPIKSDEEVILFPTAAAWDPAARAWRAPLHLWIYEPERGDYLRERLLSDIRAALGDRLTPDEATILEARLRLFLRDNERGKSLRVQVGQQLHELPPTAPHGHAESELLLPGDPPTGTTGADLVATVAALDGRRFVGRVRLIPPTGLSVISDIDDTIKATSVRDRAELIRNTFVRTFQPVQGMADAYQRWAREGAEFHYVSNSPWQLYEPLAELIASAGFPAGSVHLRMLRLKDESLLKFLTTGTEAKTAQIESLLRRFPERRFVLVGDSGEHDPELYGDIARRLRSQVLRICIRDVSGEARESERYAAAFRDLPDGVWQVFHDPDELQPLLPAAR